ncbi:hypothetical protein Ate02nite_48690 [Paractinoplanes tereljensis]|uniref:Uncharacterized protein n=1 Tax=Paractinoplanes tereljensis TaxID=571912 RepID=A0A919NQE7_9ACTN|nr:hypothetical protein Ate02nite_48690 [Actinoplanes tereljensis]
MRLDLPAAEPVEVGTGAEDVERQREEDEAGRDYGAAAKRPWSRAARMVATQRSRARSTRVRS